jgi:hypothetical protein
MIILHHSSNQRSPPTDGSSIISNGLQGNILEPTDMHAPWSDVDNNESGYDKSSPALLALETPWEYTVEMQENGDAVAKEWCPRFFSSR